MTKEYRGRYEWMFVPKAQWVTAATHESPDYYTNGRHLFSKSYLVWL